MDARDYLTDIKARLVASAAIASIRIVEEYALPDRGYIRVRLELINTDFLEAAEYFVVEGGQWVTQRYRYQWMDGAQKTLRQRWDNVEHFPGLRHFPHHVHVGEESHVESGRSISIIELIAIVERHFNDSDFVYLAWAGLWIER